MDARLAVAGAALLAAVPGASLAQAARPGVTHGSRGVSQRQA